MLISPLSFEITLLSKKFVSSKVIQLAFESNPRKLTEFIPGQYMSIQMNPHARRSYSVSTTRGIDQDIETYADISPGGVGSQVLEHLQIGESLNALGPLGKFHWPMQLDRSAQAPIIFLATGTGIVPIFAMLKDLIKNNVAKRQILLFWGLRFANDIFLADQFAKFQAESPYFHYRISLSRPTPDWTGLTGYCTEQLWQAWPKIPHIANAQFFLCGSREMVDSAREKLTTEQGIALAQIWYEKFY